MLESLRSSWWPIAKAEDVERSEAGLCERDRLGRVAKALIAARSLRADHLPGDSLGEPVWDVLLGLYVAYADQVTLNITTAVRSSRVPATTAIRWIDHLVVNGLVCRTAVACDRRSSNVCLSPKGITAMETILRRQAEVLEGFCKS